MNRLLFGENYFKPEIGIVIWVGFGSDSSASFRSVRRLQQTITLCIAYSPTVPVHIIFGSI